MILFSETQLFKPIKRSFLNLLTWFHVMELKLGRVFNYDPSKHTTEMIDGLLNTRSISLQDIMFIKNVNI